MTTAYKLSDDTTLEFDTNEQVFTPTGTSLALIKALKENITSPGRTLDLGAGCGIVGIVAHKLGLVKPPLCASDLGEAAVMCAQQNADKHNVPVIAKAGSLFDPWEGEKFDVILDDVSGVAKEVAEASPWFRNVSCESGVDGTDLILRVLEQAPAHLNDGGVLFFPIISLSNEKKILERASKLFASVKKVVRQEWPLPEEMRPHLAMLSRLNDEGHITVTKKFGMVVLYTDIYTAQL